MNTDLHGRRALVTGASRGIGRAIAEALAGEGARVAVVARTPADIATVIGAMGTDGGHEGVALDLMPQGAPSELVRRLGDFGPIDIVVHNVGGTLGITDPMCGVEEWRRVWRLNVEIGIELNRLLLPSMRDRHWGRIVHVSSIAAAENQGPVPYCAAKAALTAYSRSLGRVVARDGVVVSAVLPGAIFTENGYWDEASRQRPDHVAKYVSERMAIGRFGRPDEISYLVTFLCSERASFCIGSVVPVDGGQGRTYFGF